jgi:hypothetical protein
MLLEGVLNTDSDGWIPSEEWVIAKEKHKVLFDQWVESIKESGSSEEHARKLWSFDEVLKALLLSEVRHEKSA